MPGDPALGGLLRELRVTHRLTMSTLARRVGCAESLISLVETGKRPLQPWLAERLDLEYRTGGTLSAILMSESSAGGECSLSPPTSDILVIQVAPGNRVATVSRRDLLAALGIGAIGGAALDSIQRILGKAEPTPELLEEFEVALGGFQSAARTMPPARIIDSLIGRTASLDVMRHRSPPELRDGITRVQARYAECLSWMHEEANDIHGSLYWIDRSTHWAQETGWGSMAAYGFVRRSMLALSYLDDSRAAILSAETALHAPGASHRVKGLASKQLAFSLALTRRADDCNRALDMAMQHLSEDEAIGDDYESTGVGQRSVVNDDLFAIFRATCDVYLGRGDSVIPVLEPRLARISCDSLRTHTITNAKLAHAYASTGSPELACSLLRQSLSAANAIDSLSAKRELRRAAPALTYWDRRPEVREVLHDLSSSLQPPNL